MVIKSVARFMLFLRVKKGDCHVWRVLTKKCYMAPITIDQVIRFSLARVNQYPVEHKRIRDLLIKIQKLRERKIRQEGRQWLG